MSELSWLRNVRTRELPHVRGLVFEATEGVATATDLLGLLIGWLDAHPEASLLSVEFGMDDDLNACLYAYYEDSPL